MTALIITPEEFRDTVEKILARFSARLVKIWNEKSYKDYTKFWENEKGVYGAIANEYHLIYRTNYWEIDGAFYREEEKLVLPHSRGKFLSLAIEHENDARTSYEEVNKLAAHVNASLGVVITYPETKSGGRYPDAKKLLKNYSRQVRDADVFGDFGQVGGRSIMAVFGYFKRKTIKWDYFLYKNEGFVKL
ncbi:MAG: hypothetical protein ACR2P5_06050 [Gammaproteobacteria bacterium]